MLEALDGRPGSYLMAYSSESYIGLAAAVRAGLAVTALAASAIPDDLRILGPAEGFPELPTTALGALRRAGHDSRAVDSFHDHLLTYFETAEPVTGSW